MSGDMFNPFLSGPSLNKVSSAGARSQSADQAATNVSFTTTGGADAFIPAGLYGMPPAGKDTPETVNVKALVSKVGVTGGALNPDAMSFLQGPHPEYAFV